MIRLRQMIICPPKRKTSGRILWFWYIIFYLIMLAVVIWASIYLGLNNEDLPVSAPSPTYKPFEMIPTKPIRPQPTQKPVIGLGQPPDHLEEHITEDQSLHLNLPVHFEGHIESVEHQEVVVSQEIHQVQQTVENRKMMQDSKPSNSTNVTIDQMQKELSSKNLQTANLSAEIPRNSSIDNFVQNMPKKIENASRNFSNEGAELRYLNNSVHNESTTQVIEKIQPFNNLSVGKLSRIPPTNQQKYKNLTFSPFLRKSTNNSFITTTTEHYNNSLSANTATLITRDFYERNSTGSESIASAASHLITLSDKLSNITSGELVQRRRNNQVGQDEFNTEDKHKESTVFSSNLTEEVMHE